MSATLLLQLPPDPQAPAAWCQRPAREGAPGPVTEGALAEAAAAARGRRLVVLVPQADVALRRVAVPARSRAQQARAVPFALEDEIAGDVEATHFALGPAAGEAVAVAVVSRARLDAWLAGLRDAGLEPDALCPEGLALPRDDGAWTLLPRDGGGLLRTGPAAALDLEPDTGPLVLDALLARAEPPPTALRVLATPGQPPLAEALAGVCAEHGLAVAAGDTALPALGWLARGYREGAAIDLLQGEYRTRHTLAERLAPWRPAAALAVLLLAVEGGAQVADYVRLAGAEAQLEAEVAARFREAFPEVRRVVNPRVQAEQRLAALRGGGAAGAGFLEMLTAAGEALSGAPGASLQGVTYRGSALYLDLRVGDLQSLDRLKGAIAQDPALRVSIQTASAQEDGVRGRLRIEAAAT